MEDSRLHAQIDKFTAMGIAIRFFEQYNSEVSVTDAILQGRIWKVKVSIGIMNKKIRQVEVDANTGKIRSYV